MSESLFFGKRIYILFIFALFVHILGLMLPIMDVDATQYASMSREMLETGDFLQVKERHQNYLDKPPFLFWVSSLSFYLLGVSDFAYKLPSFLFTLLGIWGLYQFAKRLFDETIGLLSALILLSCQAFFLFNHDIRTDTILSSCIILATWQIYIFVEDNKLKNLFWGYTFLAIALMTKGPVAAIIVFLALVPDWLRRRKFAVLLNWKLYVGLFYVLLLLSPMIWGLYLQYGMMGVKFFFWTQSFGRITGENVWKDDSGYFYFAHIFIWAFLPFSLLTYWATFDKIKKILQAKVFDYQETIIPLTGFLLPCLALSLSHYKLPHYIFPTFAFATMLFTQFVVKTLLSNKKLYLWASIIQNIVILVLLILLVLILGFVFERPNFLTIFGVFLGLLGFVWWWKSVRHEKLLAIVTPSVWLLILGNFVMNFYFYPHLFDYQAGTKLGEKIEHLAQTQQLDKKTVYCLGINASSFDYYGRSVFPIIHNIDSFQYLQPHPQYIVAHESACAILQQKNIAVDTIFKHDGFSISRMSLPILNSATREGYLESTYILKLK
jgi:4-amino-4-deoxy-L-arabinose transferase-like glycosyltransferase